MKKLTFSVALGAIVWACAPLRDCADDSDANADFAL